MKQINLRKIYPHCTVDRMVDVPDDVASLIWASERAEKAYERKLWRYQAIVSLDHPGFAAFAADCYSPSAEDEYEKQEQYNFLQQALRSIPDYQAERVIAHIVFGRSITEIADAEGVTKQSVYIGIKRSMLKIKENFLKLQNEV